MEMSSQNRGKEEVGENKWSIPNYRHSRKRKERKHDRRKCPRTKANESQTGGTYWVPYTTQLGTSQWTTRLGTSISQASREEKQMTYRQQTERQSNNGS